ncbi:hypothetical protein GCM10009661_63410 [Catellatospora chokoriensis]|uniref:Uncharacterized protein n=2 Tax=Catellatospora chokoriensis TaxID=310353 RepID=A0A8J3JVY8_9ACTN|nr:hypothetical protein Cch02nite_55050 [Catellatospora chokoriensis]
MTALAVALGVALTGCRGGGDRDALPPAGSDTGSTVATTPAPPPKTAAPAAPAAAVSQADKDLAELDKLLAELDGQLKKAEESPNDED